jgi:hypothetical protein
MYYHQAFPELAGDSGSGSTGSSGKGEGYRLYPDPGTTTPGGAGGGAPGTQNPILQELDPKKVISRADIVLDIAHLKAHEWHHIAVDWDDENPTYPTRLYLDFKEVQEAGAPKKPQAIIDGTANSWVRLNERQPKDSLQVGVIVREQGVDDAGVFKFFTNTIQAAGGSGVQTVSPSVKRILGNATIDELVTYEGIFPSVKQYYGGGGAPGYFTNQEGRYANVFQVPLPPDMDHVILRSFDWTSYYPTLYTDSQANQPPQKLPVTAPIRAELTFNAGGRGSPPPAFSEPWRQPSVLNLVAGRSAYARSGSIQEQRRADVVYRFSMKASAAQTGNTAGGFVQTPVIDDVTLTYFLPSPKILSQEED